VTGLLVQPIVGYLSDRTWHPFWGRRRPYFFVGSILAASALVLMPNSRAVWQAAIVLWLMDASINITMEPFRAFVGDRLPSAQRTLGFAMQTFFIGLGAVLGSQFPYLMTHLLHVSNAVHQGIPVSLKYAFYLGAICFFAAVSWTVFTTSEYPPEDREKWEVHKMQTRGLWTGFREIGKGFVHMPRTMVQLAVVQFFTWIAFFALWIYTTAAVAQQVYHTTDAQSQAFQDAGDWVGGIVFRVQRCVSIHGVSATLDSSFAQAHAYTFDLFVHRQCRINQHLFHSSAMVADMAYAGYRPGLGFYTYDALRHSGRIVAARKNGVLHGCI